MELTAPLLQKSMGCPMAVAEKWAQPLNTACQLFQITSEKRLAAFLAQVGHESLNLTKTKEALSYRADRIREIGNRSKPGTRWRSLVARADQLAGNPERFANAVYGGRMGNGPEASGDGYRYAGRGLIQLTGRFNYQAIRDHLLAKLNSTPDFEKHPELVESPQYAALTAAAFWSDNDLNELADQGAIDAISRKVNGGEEGLKDRRARYTMALKALGG